MSATTGGLRPKRPRVRDDGTEEPPFVSASESSIPIRQQGIARVGNSWIGGDFSGDARGDYSFDLQGIRTTTDRVASGGYAVAIGNDDQASGMQSVAIGNNCLAAQQDAIAIGEQCTADNLQAVAVGSSADAHGDSSVALGYAVTADAYNSIALGHQATAQASGSVAIGFDAAARVSGTMNIAALQIVRRSDPRELDPSLWPTYYGGVGVVVLSNARDLTLVNVSDLVMVLPPGCKFWVRELGLIATEVSGLVTQPTVRMGNGVDLGKFRAPVVTTRLTTAGKRERYAPAIWEDGEVRLSCAVTVGAVATAMKGRFWWEGLFVEDEG